MRDTPAANAALLLLSGTAKVSVLPLLPAGHPLRVHRLACAHGEEQAGQNEPLMALWAVRHILAVNACRSASACSVSTVLTSGASSYRRCRTILRLNLLVKMMSPAFKPSRSSSETCLRSSSRNSLRETIMILPFIQRTGSSTKLSDAFHKPGFPQPYRLDNGSHPVIRRELAVAGKEQQIRAGIVIHIDGPVEI